MHVQAPLQYIRDYYERVQRKNARHRDVADFWLGALRHIDGDSVLNVGCGPMFYDNMMHFSKPPARYVGLDLNESSFEFLRTSDDPALVKARTHAAAAGTEVEFICADIFKAAEQLSDRFDSVLGLGFFGTFTGEPFERLLGIMRTALKPGGQLLKITWHGPHRSAEETRDKLKYRYDNPEEPRPEDLVTAFERAGFKLAEQSILDCDPDAIGFEEIQVCLFHNPNGTAAP